MFPIIKTIDDVLPHIQGNDNFSVNRKDDYIVIDYILNTPETFHNPIERECRGIIFYDTGEIMSRRLHKFFNLNEREETSIDKLDMSEPHVILEKLDGSMITPIEVNGKLTWGSKAGETFLTEQVENFVKDHPEYLEFIKLYFDEWTPIFEWCSRQNRIVIDHPEDRLVLIALRNNITGSYGSYSIVKNIAEYYKIDVVKQQFLNNSNIQSLAEQVKDMKGIEGFVIRFDSGLWIKMKCEEYCRFHKAKDSINLEKNVVYILINNQADDFRTLLNEIDRKRFELFEHVFFLEFNSYVMKIYDLCSRCNYKKILRKEFAIESETWYDQQSRSLVFKFFNEDEVSIDKIKDEVIERIKKSCGSQSQVDKVREMFGGVSWYDYSGKEMVNEE